MDRRRRQYLEVMGIDLWERRGPARTEAPASAPAAPVETPARTSHRPSAAEADPLVLNGRTPSSGDALATNGGEKSGLAPAASESRAIAQAGWYELLEAIGACERCPELVANRSRSVPGVGNREADVMVIGEAPGAEEDRRGEPFVGRAGQLLDSMLRAAGHARPSVYIANVLKCRPPDNRDPRPEEAHACAGFLERQIALVAPRGILVVGRVAAQQLLRSDSPIGHLRGRVHRLPGADVPVVVTYHPAYLLRSPGEKRKVWQDLRLLRQLVREAGPSG